MPQRRSARPGRDFAPSHVHQEPFHGGMMLPYSSLGGVGMLARPRFPFNSRSSYRSYHQSPFDPGNNNRIRNEDRLKAECAQAHAGMYRGFGSPFSLGGGFSPMNFRIPGRRSVLSTGYSRRTPFQSSMFSRLPTMTAYPSRSQDYSAYPSFPSTRRPTICGAGRPGMGYSPSSLPYRPAFSTDYRRPLYRSCSYTDTDTDYDHYSGFGDDDDDDDETLRGYDTDSFDDYFTDTDTRRSSRSSSWPSSVGYDEDDDCDEFGSCRRFPSNRYRYC
ncbi:hypothetical protein BCR34DRAFT_20693 [Clohesyomyces aquaticus]|uniref:Uncharacterized protein n=1 Tax=Clohesyomyces aquaticus TaxID=1231657 RepID=A0A1Y1ZAW5_9PLEO|nr:hypothetical protein BCR34DRAFT_20693 [Clohesyomyces aquaticus]